MPAPKDRHPACVNHHPRDGRSLEAGSSRGGAGHRQIRHCTSPPFVLGHRTGPSELAQALAQPPLGAGLLVGEWLGSRPPLDAGLGEAPLSGGKPSCCSPASRTGSTPARAPSGLTGTSGWRPLPWIQTLSGVSQRATVRWMPPKLF